MTTAAPPLAVDLVSPLPPARSGIADYSADLLDELAARCDLRLVALPGQPVARELRERHSTVGPERLGEDGRLPLYQMGNNHYHEAVIELAHRVPGVVTLHDLVLHHLLIERTVARGDFEAYRRQLTLDHGWIGEAAARPLRWPGGAGNAAQFSLPAHRTLLDGQRGVLVHSRWAAEQLQEELALDRVRTIPMGVPPGVEGDVAGAAAFRRRHGIPAGVPLLGAFGFQTPMKRTATAIQALSSPSLSGAHLMVVGEESAVCDLAATARRSGVEDRVHRLGYLPFAELETALSSVDLCLNLRYPTAGETSASLLRIMAAGRAVVVSDYAQHAELPAELVVKVRPGAGEARRLAASMAELLAAPQRLREMGRAARRHVVEHHSPARAAAAVVEACTGWREEAPIELAPPAVPRPTSLIWRDLAGELEVFGATTPWPVGARRSLTIRLTNRSEAVWLAAERQAGGVGLQVELWSAGGDLRREAPWIPLPFDLEPGASWTADLEVRCPRQGARLSIEPHVLGRAGCSSFGGPRWEIEIGPYTGAGGRRSG